MRVVAAYLKDPVESTHDAFTASPWVLAAGAISAVALLSLVICLLLLATTRHKRARRIAGQHVGATNLSYEPDDPRPALSEQGSTSVGSATKILPSDDGDWELDSEAMGDDPPSTVC